MAERTLIDLDGKRSRTPFKYRGFALGMLREDQIPRFLSALTDPDVNTEEIEISLADLYSMQDRVDTAKVEGFFEAEDAPLPIVVRLNGDCYGGDLTHADHIADGHHRLAAAWLRGEETARVRMKDLREPSNALKHDARIVKVDDALGLVFGWAIISKIGGEDYFDSQDEHVPEDVMLKSVTDFAQSARVMDDMHSGILSGADGPNHHGSIVFMMPMTTEVAKAFGIVTKVSGLMIAAKPSDPDILQKFKDGTYTGFSIGGSVLDSEEVADAA